MAQLVNTEIIIGSSPNQVQCNISKDIKIDSSDQIMNNQTVIDANTSLPSSSTDIGPMSSTNELHYPESVDITFSDSSSQNPYQDQYINKLMDSLPKLPMESPSSDMIDILSEMETSSDWANLRSSLNSPNFISSFQFIIQDNIFDENAPYCKTAKNQVNIENYADQSLVNGFNVNNSYSSDYKDYSHASSSVDETKKSNTTTSNILEKTKDEVDVISHYSYRDHGKPLSYIKQMKANHLDYKKQQRNEREKKRRNDLKNAFELLRALLPNSQVKKKYTKHQILTNAAVFCNILQIKEQKLLEEIKKT